jgi:hypothetical protein
MIKIKRCDGFLGCRTTKEIEQRIKELCEENKRGVSEVMNYLCRLFIEDFDEIRSKFFEEKE